ncbi:MAG: fatty acid desaturase, partial [Rivularia sp. ALOHA_DT_140]|nr:fatty acid desaturase [Rivularia sp. ALOHA_DT_140]
MGFNLVGLFIVFHDAGHRTRSKNIKLNDFQGDIAAGLVGCGISWVLARESHRKHHLDTGKIKDPTALWKIQKINCPTVGVALPSDTTTRLGFARKFCETVGQF